MATRMVLKNPASMKPATKKAAQLAKIRANSRTLALKRRLGVIPGNYRDLVHVAHDWRDNPIRMALPQQARQAAHAEQSGLSTPQDAKPVGN
jgi:hypothetical protein